MAASALHLEAPPVGADPSPDTTARAQITQRFEELTALSRPARAAVDANLGAQPRIGEAPLFPRSADEPMRPVNNMQASYWLKRAERFAGFPKLERGGFRAFRRLWASERRHLPDVDMAKAGGWRDVSTMKRSYQKRDPATVLQAIEKSRRRRRRTPATSVSRPNRGATDTDRTDRYDKP